MILPEEDRTLSRVNPSCPVYSGLESDRFAKCHLIMAETEGASAVIDLFAKAESAFAKRATLLYVADAAVDQATLHQLDQLGANVFCLFADIPALLRDCAQRMEEATMETRLYVCGRVDFIGRVAGVAGRYGVGFDSLRTEHRGSLAKRVQCIHCKFTEDQVFSETVVCSRCKLKLFVRDHFSYRLNAFMGVSIDAETAIDKLSLWKAAL